MIELPLNVAIYGFAFGDSFTDINLDEVYSNLEFRKIFLSDVTFTIWDDEISSCTWLIAGNRLLDNEESMNVIEFLVDNELQEDYLLMAYTGE